MATGWSIQVSLPSVTGLPRDNVVNTFALQGGGPIPPGESFVTLMSDFYNEGHIGEAALVTWLSPALSRTLPATVKVFSLADPEPREPVEEGTFTLDGTVPSNPLPLEVAVCLSFQGAQNSGENNRRRKGRIYFGPLGTNAVGSTVSGMPTVDANLRNALLSTGQWLNVETNGAWSVWSRLDDTVYGITQCSVDNEFDTQRRRQRPPTQRFVRPFG